MDFGTQPMNELMIRLGLSNADLVKAQSDQLQGEIKNQLGLTNQFKPAINPLYSLPPPPMPVDSVPSPRQLVDDNFVNQTRQLIEILIGAGRKAEAKDIQGQAVAILDNPRLRSAVSDAMQQVQKLSSRNP